MKNVVSAHKLNYVRRVSARVHTLCHRISLGTIPFGVSTNRISFAKTVGKFSFRTISTELQHFGVYVWLNCIHADDAEKESGRDGKRTPWVRKQQQNLKRWCDTQVEGTCHSQPLQSNQIWHIIAKNISCHSFLPVPAALSLSLSHSLPRVCVYVLWCSNRHYYYCCCSFILFGRQVWSIFFFPQELRERKETGEKYRKKKQFPLRMNGSRAKRIHIWDSGMCVYFTATFVLS